jgi:hypothetical protein
MVWREFVNCRREDSAIDGSTDEVVDTAGNRACEVVEAEARKQHRT